MDAGVAVITVLLQINREHGLNADTEFKESMQELNRALSMLKGFKGVSPEKVEPLITKIVALADMYVYFMQSKLDVLSGWEHICVGDLPGRWMHTNPISWALSTPASSLDKCQKDVQQELLLVDQHAMRCHQDGPLPDLAHLNTALAAVHVVNLKYLVFQLRHNAKVAAKDFEAMKEAMLYFTTHMDVQEKTCEVAHKILCHELAWSEDGDMKHAVIEGMLEPVKKAMCTFPQEPALLEIALQALGSIGKQCRGLSNEMSADLLELVHKTKNAFPENIDIQKSALYASAHLVKDSKALAAAALLPGVRKDMERFNKDVKVQCNACLAVKHLCEGVGVQNFHSEALTVSQLIRQASEDFSDDDEMGCCAQEALAALWRAGIEGIEGTTGCLNAKHGQKKSKFIC